MFDVGVAHADTYDGQHFVSKNDLSAAEQKAGSLKPGCDHPASGQWGRREQNGGGIQRGAFAAPVTNLLGRYLVSEIIGGGGLGIENSFRIG